MAAPDSQETTVEITINGQAYTEGNPTAEEVCKRYGEDLIGIIQELGDGVVEIDAVGLILRARFNGGAEYLPGVDIEGMMDGEGDSLKITLANGNTNYLGYYRYGINSVIIDGEEKWAA